MESSDVDVEAYKALHTYQRRTHTEQRAFSRAQVHTHPHHPNSRGKTGMCKVTAAYKPRQSLELLHS